MVSKLWEDVLFLDGVVGVEVVAEVEADAEELENGEVFGAAVGDAGVVEGCPGLAESGVLCLRKGKLVDG